MSRDVGETKRFAINLNHSSWQNTLGHAEAKKGDCIPDKPTRDSSMGVNKLEVSAMSAFSAPYMHNEAAAFAHVEAMLLADGPVCPHCGGGDSAYKLVGVRTDLMG